MLNFSTKPVAAAAFLATFALGACSSSSSSSGGTAGASGGAVAPTLVEVINFANLANDDFARIEGDGITDAIPGTAFAQLNATTTGSATYRGPGGVSIFVRETNEATTSDVSVVDMLGTAAVTVDFESDTFDGKIVDLFAVNADGGTDLVVGRVAIEDGKQVDPTGRPTAIAADATGSLEAFGTTYEIDVPLEGLLRGTNPSAADGIPVKAISLSGEGTVADSTLLADVFVVGDKDAANQGAFVNRDAVVDE